MEQTCVICGRLILSAPIRVGQKWLGRIRLARCPRSKDSFVTVTGVGYAERAKLIVPKDASSCISHGESSSELERHWNNSYSPLTVFHDSCWNMLLDYVSLKATIKYEKNDIAQCLYDIVSDLPQGENCSVIIGQQGFKRFWQENSPLPVRYEYVGANPDTLPIMQVMDMKTFETETGPLPFETDANSFTQLPTELIYHLVSFIDSPSLCNFRLSSKTIASLIHPDDLPRAFWASRFAVDHEMGFFPLNYDTTLARKDWRQLYFNLKENLKERSRVGHMRSRKRIWSCIKRLRSPILMMLQQTPNFEVTSSLVEDITLRGLYATEKIQGIAKINALREKGSQFVDLDPKRAGADDLRVSISTINLKSTRYICGIRISTGDGIIAEGEISRVGFVLDSIETHLCFRADARLVAIRVAVSIGGIIGLSFQEEDAMGDVLWQSVGQLDNLPDFSGVVTLKPRTKN